MAKANREIKRKLLVQLTKQEAWELEKLAELRGVKNLSKLIRDCVHVELVKELEDTPINTVKFKA